MRPLARLMYALILSNGLNTESLNTVYVLTEDENEVMKAER